MLLLCLVQFGRHMVLQALLMSAKATKPPPDSLLVVLRTCTPKYLLGISGIHHTVSVVEAGLPGCACRFMSAQEVQSQWARDLAGEGPQRDDMVAGSVSGRGREEQASRRGSGNSRRDADGLATTATGVCAAWQYATAMHAAMPTCPPLKNGALKVGTRCLSSAIWLAVPTKRCDCTQ